MKHLLIILSLLLLSSPLFGQSKETGVLFLREVDGKDRWFYDGEKTKDWKYIGEIEFGKPNGQGTLITTNGEKYVGEFKDGLQMVMEQTQLLMEGSMKVSGKMEGKMDMEW